MKPHIIAAMLIFGAMLPLKAQKNLDIIPVPSKITYLEGEYQLRKGVKIYSDTDDNFNSEYLKNHISSLFDFPIESTTEPHNADISLLTDSKIEKEGYSIEINNNGITIKASDDAGIFYGVQTLFQMLPPQIYSGEKLRLQTYSLPSVLIEDTPRFPYRGFMLDVSRTFFDTQYIKQYLDWMSYHKLNTFHWHLTDDNGWRIEIKKYPLLTSRGAWRGKNEILPPTYNSPSEKYGGYYTQKEIKEIVAYAAKRNITIIPEIDLPGHSLSMTACYPEVTCGTTTNTPSACGEFNNVWCVGNENNYKILNNIIKEIASLFPGEYINIGGDEVILDYWKQCPKCTALMQKEGMKDPYQLMGYFVKRMETIIEKNGKKMIGWDDIQDNGGLNQHTAVVAWRSLEKGMESISKGHPTVMQIAQYCYVDMRQSPQERGHQWAAIIPVERVYSFDPIGSFKLTPEQEKLVLGTQAGLWTELMQYPPRFSEYQVFPRLCAISEVAWSDTANRNYDDFRSRLINKHYDRLLNMGIAFRVEPPKILYEDQCLKVSLPYPSAEIRYTTDKSDPTNNSNIYQGQIITDSPENFRFATFFGRGLQSITTAAENIELHHYLTPVTTIETDIKVRDNTPLENVTTYDFNKIVKTVEKVKAGNYFTYIFKDPVKCNTITINTGYTDIPFYGVSDGYIEYTYDGKNYIKGENFHHYSATIKNIQKPIKAVRIIITYPNDGWQCNFQNLKIE